MSSRIRIIFDDAGNVEHFHLAGCAATEAADRRGVRAMLLAPTLEVCRALLAAEAVPLSSLDQGQVARFGLRS